MARLFRSDFMRISFNAALFLLLSAHLAGLIGLQWTLTRPLFQWLVPFNLLMTACLLFSFHSDWRGQFVLFLLLAGVGGYLLEVAGVHTGLIFGVYQYGKTLGFQLVQVPLLIGVNWCVLLYACGAIAEKTRLPTLPKILLGASLMTFLDVWIEPIAIRFDFWSWAGGVVPLQNYIAWFIASSLLLWAYYSLHFRRNNPLAGWVYGAQLVFFFLHNLL